MTAFQVDDMTCGHCVSSVTKAVKVVDSGARMQFDLATHRVEIESTNTDAAELSGAIKEAGYTPVAIAAGPRTAETMAAVPARKGCSCG